MLRRMSKKLVGKKPRNMLINDYYKIVNHVESKITTVFITGLVIGVGTGVGATVAIPKLHCAYVTNHHYGHYEADYIDENGAYHDIDDDGDMYHWVYDCTQYCNGNHGEEE